MFWQLLLVLVLLIPILAIVLDSQVGRALAARLEGGTQEEKDRLLERIRYLEGEVDRLSDRVIRLEEESEFLHDLLTDQPPNRRSIEPGDSDG